ncbi:hypothetical protein [Paenibacillus sp. FSL W7-1332]|uniref:hypothetical protein n=1 Tax=Paenibacillus sp. FSL W7-1332 TaxID=2921702 RepID=UPI0030D13228
MLWLMVNFAMTVSLPIFGGIAAWNASRAYRAPTKDKLYSRKRSSLIWTGISGLAFFVKATPIILTSRMKASCHRLKSAARRSTCRSERI